LFVQPVPVQQERHDFLKRYTLKYQLFRFSEVGYALSLLAAGQCIERDIDLASCRIGIKGITRTAQTPRASIFFGAEFEPVIPDFELSKTTPLSEFLNTYPFFRDVLSKNYCMEEV
jgi:hypothetical protein